MQTRRLRFLRQIISENALTIKDTPEIDLASGIKSYFFFDMKTVLLCPEGANLITDEIIERLKNVEFDYIGGVATGCIPIVALICANTAFLGRHVEGFFVRKEEKDHGARKKSTNTKIQGNIKENSRVIIVDDVTTTGTSIRDAINEVLKLDCEVVKVITVVDRCQGAKEKVLEQGFELDAIFTARDFGLNAALGLKC